MNVGMHEGSTHVQCGLCMNMAVAYARVVCMHVYADTPNNTRATTTANKHNYTGRGAYRLPQARMMHKVRSAGLVAA